LSYFDVVYPKYFAPKGLQDETLKEVFHESFNSKNADHSQSFPPWPKTLAENLWGRTAGPNWPLWLGRQSKRMLDMAITTSQCSKNGNSSSGGKMFFLANIFARLAWLAGWRVA